MSEQHSWPPFQPGRSTVSPPVPYPRAPELIRASEPLEVSAKPVWMLVLEAVMNVVVIVTCVAILYTLYRGYVAVHQLQDALRELADQWGKAWGN